MLSVNLLPGAGQRAGDSGRRCGWKLFPKTLPMPTPRHAARRSYQRQVVRFETVMKNQFDAANAVQQVQVGIESDDGRIAAALSNWPSGC